MRISISVRIAISSHGRMHSCANSAENCSPGIARAKFYHFWHKIKRYYPCPLFGGTSSIIKRNLKKQIIIRIYLIYFMLLVTKPVKKLFDVSSFDLLLVFSYAFFILRNLEQKSYCFVITKKKLKKIRKQTILGHTTLFIVPGISKVQSQVCGPVP